MDTNVQMLYKSEQHHIEDMSINDIGGLTHEGHILYQN